MSAAGVAHCSWGLWGTWRRGPDVVAHVADVVAECTDSVATIRVRYREDEEQTTSDEQLDLEITAAALKHFRELLIESGDDALKVRVTLIRSPTDILIGAHQARRARVRAGVVLEVTSSDPTQGKEVEAAARRIRAALNRGRPRFVTRPPKYGHAGRTDPAGGSASRALERKIRGWPPRSAFPLVFTALSLVVYAAGIWLLTAKKGLIVADQELELDSKGASELVVAGGLAIAVAAFIAQSWLFAAVEVNTVPNTRRAFKAVTSSLSITVVTGVLLKFLPLGDFFG